MKGSFLKVFLLVVMFQGLVADFAGVEEVSWGGPVARLPGLAGDVWVLRGRRILGSPSSA